MKINLKQLLKIMLIHRQKNDLNKQNILSSDHSHATMTHNFIDYTDKNGNSE